MPRRNRKAKYQGRKHGSGRVKPLPWRPSFKRPRKAHSGR